MSPAFFCTHCGAQSDPSARFCSLCGATTTPAPAATATAPAPTFSPVPAYGTGAAPYAPMAPVLTTGYGGFWIRVLAAIIDTVILRIVIAPVSLVFGALGFASRMTGLPHTPFALLGGAITIVLFFFGSWLYEALLESSSYQATLGKMVFGMKVADVNGNRISFARATGRHFAKILSGALLGLGYIMAGLTERKQGLHDLLAGTLVRRT